MPQILSVAASAANSSDFVVTGSLTLMLKDGTANTSLPLNSVVYVQAKADSQYITIGALTDKEPVKTLTGGGTYRVSRPILAYAVGVNSET